MEDFGGSFGDFAWYLDSWNTTANGKYVLILEKLGIFVFWAMNDGPFELLQAWYLWNIWLVIYSRCNKQNLCQDYPPFLYLNIVLT